MGEALSFIEGAQHGEYLPDPSPPPVCVPIGIAGWRRVEGEVQSARTGPGGIVANEKQYACKQRRSRPGASKRHSNRSSKLKLMNTNKMSSDPGHQVNDFSTSIVKKSFRASA